jgi:hypothetical protein
MNPSLCSEEPAPNRKIHDTAHTCFNTNLHNLFWTFRLVIEILKVVVNQYTGVYNIVTYPSYVANN